MRRRQYLAISGATLTTGLAGCTDGGTSGTQPNADTTQTSTPDPAALGSESDPWTGALLTVQIEEPENLPQYFDAEVSLILTRVSAHTAFIQSAEPEAVVETAQEAGLTVLRSGNSQWTGEPVCDIRSRILLPSDPSEAEVRDTFTDAIAIKKVASTSGQYWDIYTRISDSDTISGYIEELGGSGGASLQTFTGCLRPES